jgi:hypothetical protein
MLPKQCIGYAQASGYVLYQDPQSGLNIMITTKREGEKMAPVDCDTVSCHHMAKQDNSSGYTCIANKLLPLSASVARIRPQSLISTHLSECCYKLGGPCGLQSR